MYAMYRFWQAQQAYTVGDLGTASPQENFEIGPIIGEF